MLRHLVVAGIILSLASLVAAQGGCDELAVREIVAAYSKNIDNVNQMFREFDAIKDRWSTCHGDTDVQVEVTDKAQVEITLDMSASEVVDGRHLTEGLWKMLSEYRLSDTCTERKRHDSLEFFEDVYFGDSGLLVWDGGNPAGNFTFEFLTARRFSYVNRNLQWVDEYVIETATADSMSGTYTAYWHGNKDFGCTFYGSFSGELIDTNSACVVYGEANIRTHASTRSPTNGEIDAQRRAIDRALGDDGYYWWKLSDDEYVREDVVSASRSCERL